ncbi:hypothetical protein EJ08DRAFT_108241 [Tothia fuscella]|uniref:Uncharacterized protein n=1 Tax=Tothia fuscella TaxID=1048955 RepID=A0A9P4NE35_9PEZI|nr:hypothetical protein EJ08DRAFT_108241 [Tothia fuscella]
MVESSESESENESEFEIEIESESEFESEDGSERVDDKSAFQEERQEHKVASMEMVDSSGTEEQEEEEEEEEGNSDDGDDDDDETDEQEEEEEDTFSKVHEYSDREEIATEHESDFEDEHNEKSSTAPIAEDTLHGTGGVETTVGRFAEGKGGGYSNVACERYSDDDIGCTFKELLLSPCGDGLENWCGEQEEEEEEEHATVNRKEYETHTERPKDIRSGSGSEDEDNDLISPRSGIIDLELLPQPVPGRDEEYQRL